MSPRGGSTAGRVVAGTSASQRERRGAGPLTPKGRERRSEILRAARKVFEERGFVDTRVADIVAAAGVAQGTFYSYFDSKEAVFAEVAQQAVETMMDGLHTDFVRDIDPVERIRRAMVRFVEAFRPNAVMIGLIDRSARGIRRMQADGIADPELDPVIMAEILGAMVDQTCYIWFFLGKEFDPAAVAESLTTAWARTIGIRDA